MNDSQDKLTTCETGIIEHPESIGQKVHFQFALGDIVSYYGLKCTVIGQYNYRTLVNYVVQNASGGVFTVHCDDIKRWCDS